jgi:hypothetical protein
MFRLSSIQVGTCSSLQLGIIRVLQSSRLVVFVTSRSGTSVNLVLTTAAELTTHVFFQLPLPLLPLLLLLLLLRFFFSQSRFKRPYDTLRPTQQRERRKQATAEISNILTKIDCPRTAVLPTPSTPPSNLIHLSTAVREQIRSVSSLHIPCERTLIKIKQSLSSSHATATSVFEHGAYISDPLRLINLLTSSSPFIAVGGDTGGGQTKLGVTYLDLKGVQTFLCLLVYEGSDSWEDLAVINQPHYTPFKGDSLLFTSILALFQHLIDTRSALLNGDWPFINNVLGLKAPTNSQHPCPICIISKSNFLGSSRYRKQTDKHSLHPEYTPLLSIDPERIVPTPLHLFLGLSNRIIKDAFTEIFGKEVVEAAMGQVTTIHTPGCGGKSDLFDLNGPEIRKWIKKELNEKLKEDKENMTDKERATHSILTRWLKNLHDYLLHKKEWTVKQIEEWKSAVDDIQRHWQQETTQHPFPKLHMLKHAAEFAERHRFLGRASEAQIESFHFSFNSLFNNHHFNQSNNTPERLRRCLADATLRAVQPIIVSSS